MLTLNAIMTRSVVAVDMDDTLRRIREIFEESSFHHLVVTDQGKVAGVISDRDLLKRISPFVGNQWLERPQDLQTLQVKAHQIMTRRPVTAPPDTTAADAAAMLLNERISCLPVVGADRRLKGIVTWRDIMPHCFGCAVQPKAA